MCISGPRKLQKEKICWRQAWLGSVLSTRYAENIADMTIPCKESSPTVKLREELALKLLRKVLAMTDQWSLPQSWVTGNGIKIIDACTRT